MVGQNKNFTDIMKQYRNQPQAASHVYRSVLLKAKAEAATASGAAKEKENEDSRPMAPPTPTKLAATSTITADGEERGDLIKFYNIVFMERLQEFSLKFKQRRCGGNAGSLTPGGGNAGSGQPASSDAPPLSPLPKLRAHPQSPCRRVSDHHSVYIRPLKSNTADVVTSNPHSPHKPLSYQFSRSPAKDLRAINALMRTEGERRAAASSIGKRLLVDDAASSGQQQQQQVLLIQQGEGEPPAKMQIVAATNGAAAAATTTTESRWSSRLGIVLDDRQQQQQQTD